MPEISEIGVGRVSVPEIPTWRNIPPQSIPSAPPITSIPGFGFPVAEIPGCVETRNTQPGNRSAYTNDPRGNFVVCGGTMPSYNPINFTPGTLPSGAARPPALTPKKKPAASQQPAASPSPSASLALDIPNLNPELPCPPPDAIPIGAKNKLQTAVIIGYERVDGECKAQLDPLDIPTIVGNHLPGTPVVVTTATVAAVGVTSAILAKPLGDILLKAIKPIVKKTIKKIKEKLGKKVVVESAWQRRKFQRSLKT